MDVSTSKSSYLPRKCLICMNLIIHSIPVHFQTIHNLSHEIHLLLQMTVPANINIKIEKLEGDDNLEIHIPYIKKEAALGCRSGDCCNNPRYLVDKNTGQIIKEDNLAPLYEWCDRRPAKKENIPKVLEDFVNSYNDQPSHPFISVQAPLQQYLEISYKCPHCNHRFVAGEPAETISNHYATNHIKILLDGITINSPKSTSEKPLSIKKCKNCHIHCPIQDHVKLSQGPPISTDTLEMEYSVANEDENLEISTIKNRKKGINCETIYKPMISYKCKGCRYFTDLKHNLSRHEKIHDKNPSCKQCGKIFVNITKFKEHIGIEHGRYNCNICHKVFKSSRPLKGHKQRNHK